MDREFLKEQYKSEIERKDTLTSSMAIPVGVLTVLGGLLGLLSRDFSYEPTNISLAFVAVLAISALLFLISIVLLFCAYHGYTYSYLPTAKELKEYFDGLSVYLRQTKSSTESDDVVVDRVGKQFNDMLERRYIEAITVNSGNNDKKSGYLHWANTCLITALAAALVAVIPFTIDSKVKHKEVQEVRVVNLPVQPLKEESGNVSNPGEQTHGAAASQSAGTSANSSSSTGATKPKNKGNGN
jgi:uncharacterized protein with PQ loop repeat